MRARPVGSNPGTLRLPSEPVHGVIDALGRHDYSAATKLLKAIPVRLAFCSNTYCLNLTITRSAL